MRRVIALVLLSVTFSRSIAAGPIESRLLWRSSEIQDGVVLGDIHRIVPTLREIFVVHGTFMNTELLAIDSDGTTSTVVDLAGEAPGHLQRPYDVDVRSDGNMLALVSGMPGRVAVRTPVQPPFDHTSTIEPHFDAPGMSSGMGVRIVDGAVLTHMGQQPATDLQTRIVRIVHHDLDSPSATVLREESGPLTNRLDGALFWVWDAGADGSVFLSDDYHSGVITAHAPDGTLQWRTEVPVQIVRKSDEVIEANRASYEQQRGRVPDELIPVLLENYRAVDELCARAGDGLLRVVSAAGRGVGREAIESVSWWLVDMETGEVIGQESLDLPDGTWSFYSITWFGDRIYLAGEDQSRGGEPEVFCFERVR
jgi:hypothetical protein